MGLPDGYVGRLRAVAELQYDGNLARLRQSVLRVRRIGRQFGQDLRRGLLQRHDGAYSAPVIEFAKTPRTVAYLYMAPSTMLDSYYKYDLTAARDRTFGFRITGSLNGESTGTVDVTLVKNSTVEAGWVKVDLSALGQVDKLAFAPEGINPNVDFDPVYFCLDEIALVKE